MSKISLTPDALLLTRAARLKGEKEAFELIGGSTFKVDPESVQTINA
jgi:hypothetical protein